MTNTNNNEKLDLSIDNSVRVLYIINNSEQSLKMNQSDKFSLFKKYVSVVYPDLDLNDYDFFYNNKKLPKSADNKILKDFMDKTMDKTMDKSLDKSILERYDPNLIRFTLKLNKVQQLSKLRNEKQNHQNTLKIKVQVEHFPSRTEIYLLLKKFLLMKNLPSEYCAENRGGSIDFLFADSENAFEFLKFLNKEKVTNPLYSKMRTNIVLDEPSNKHLFKESTSSDKYEGLLTSLNNSASSKNNSIDIISNKRVKTENNSSLNRSNKSNVKSYMLPLLKINNNDKTKKRNIKKDWLAKQDFKRYVGKASLNKRFYVPNYVNLTPSESPLEYKFRMENKKNWIAKTNFIA